MCLFQYSGEIYKRKKNPETSWGIRDISIKTDKIIYNSLKVLKIYKNRRLTV